MITHFENSRLWFSGVKNCTNFPTCLQLCLCWMTRNHPLEALHPFIIDPGDIIQQPDSDSTCSDMLDVGAETNELSDVVSEHALEWENYHVSSLLPADHSQSCSVFYHLVMTDFILHARHNAWEMRIRICSDLSDIVTIIFHEMLEHCQHFIK